MTFFEFLTERVRAADSLLCVGLDPRAGDVAGLRAECFRLIDATAEFAACFKPNSAFFEMHGPEGVQALREVIAHVPAGIPVLLDAKRGDIAATAEAYAQAVFDRLGAHALTVSPYLGGDAIAPFLARPDRGAFVLCKTSNPGADEFQALRGDFRPLYEIVAAHAQRWNVNGNVGLVVGATDPAAMVRVRAEAPDLWFLVPGVGAQGGDLEETLRAGLRPDGMGLLIAVSRSLVGAPDPRAAAVRLRAEINRFRSGAPSPAPETDLTALARDLATSGCVRFGQFKLKSGIESPIYLDLRRLVSYPEILRRVAQAFARVLSRFDLDRLAGIPYAGLPIATAVSLEMGLPLIYPRREVKAYGTRAAVEGGYAEGDRVAVIDDLATTGGTKIEAIQTLERAGLRAREIVVLIDREQGAGEMLAAAGYRLHAVATLRQLLPEWVRLGALSQEQHDQVLRFLESS